MAKDTAWKRVTLGQVAESMIDGPFGSNLKSEHYVAEPGARVIRLQNIQVGSFNNSDRAYISRDHFLNLSRHAVLPGDLLVAALGDDTRPTARACIAPPEIAPAIVKADCFRIRMLRDFAVEPFVMRVLNHDMNRAALSALSQGVTRDRVNLHSLSRFKITLPALPEQQRIVEILDAIDDRIDVALRLQKKADARDRATVQALLEPALRMLRAVEPSQVHGLVGSRAAEWTIVTLGSQLQSIQAGNSPDLEDRPAAHGEWGVLKVSAVKRSGFAELENKVVSDLVLVDPSLEVCDGDLLMTRANTSELVGQSCVVKCSRSGLMLSDKTLRLTVSPNEGIPQFVNEMLATPEVRRQIEVAATGTSGTMKNIGQQAIRNLVIPWADRSIQARLVGVVEASQAMRQREHLNLAKLRNLKQALMDDLLTGQVRVGDRVREG